MPSADPVLVLPPTSPPVLIAPITTPPVVIGPATSGGTLTGGGSAGEVAVWDGSTDLTGLTPGTDGQVLTANSAAPLGVDWEDPPVVADFGGSAQLTFFTTFPNIASDGNLAWHNTPKALAVSGGGDALPVVKVQANVATGIAGWYETTQVDGHPLQLYAPTSFTGKFLEWFVNAVSQGAFPAAGGAYFNGAALSTSATSGFLGAPSCAGTPTGVPSGYPAGVVPLVYDTTAHKLWAYDGAAWRASGVFT